MKMSKEKAVVRLNFTELKIAAAKNNLNKKADIARAIGVSTGQLWRATLPSTDPRYNAPGQRFIAGVIAAFGEPFERFFFLEGSDTNATKRSNVQ